MAERTVELEQPTLTDETADALREATERAERAEAELAKLKVHARSADAPVADAAGQSSTRQSSSAEQDHAATANVQPHGEVSTEALKQPPSPSTAANASNSGSGPATERGSADQGGVEELRKDPMMAHLLDSLEAGTDIGHYGRLVFAMVARHFIPHNEVLAYLTKDGDFDEDQANQMLHQVEGRDYSPPRRERLLEWQREQEFQFIDPHDPDSGSLYRNLKFPQEIYQHIGHYQEAKAAE